MTITKSNIIELWILKKAIENNHCSQGISGGLVWIFLIGLMMFFNRKHIRSAFAKAGENEVPVIILSLVSATLILFFLLTVLHNIGQLTLNNEEIKLLKVELEKEKMLS